MKSMHVARMMAMALVAMVLLALPWTAGASTLQQGDSGPEVRQLQTELKDLGYYTAKLDGKYDKEVRISVNTFQIANRLHLGTLDIQLGVACDITQEMLTSPYAVTYEQYIETLKDEQCKPGGSGVYVKQVQKQLKILEYYEGTLNSKYDVATEEATRLFQAANGLKVTGEADYGTRQVMYSEDAVTRAMYDDANYITPLKLNSKGAQVEYLQKQLTVCGYYQAEVHAQYDKATYYAVSYFQEAHGLPVTGAADRTTRTLLNLNNAIIPYNVYAAQQALAEVKQGSRGLAVALLQQRLIELDYFDGAVNGVFGARLKKSVSRFQVFNNLSDTGTGIADEATRLVLNSESALSYNQVYGPDTLKKGDKGSEVKKLQTQLKLLGYKQGNIDGVYDATVVSAVKAFQKANGLSVTGVAYSTTRAKLADKADAVGYNNYRAELVIQVAESKLGKPYYGTTSGATSRRGPNSFDCSGFTYYCFKQIGITLSSEVSAQGRNTKGKRITTLSELERGDLLYFDTQEGKSPGHAAIYLGRVSGKQRFIHCSSAKKRVVVTEFSDWYTERFMWGIRVW